MNALLSERKDFYHAQMNIDIIKRTAHRLNALQFNGFSEVGTADFGISGKTSGLYIESVWNMSDESFNDYIDWAKKVSI